MDGGRWLLLLVAVIAVSWAAPLIRLASDVDPAVVGFWRTSIATIVLAPWALPRLRGSLSSLSRLQRLALVCSGTLLAAHFIAWIASVNMTTVAASALLVSSSPVFLALLRTIVGRPPSVTVWTGIGLAVAGGAVVVGSTVQGSLQGNVLATVGALAAAGYLLVGSSLRRKLDVIPYVFCVYGVASLVLLAVATARGGPFEIPRPESWIVIMSLGLGPQLLGHTTLNLLLDRMDPTKVAMATMAEPLGSTLIAASLFSEFPRGRFYFGGALLLGGIALCLVGKDDPGWIRSGVVGGD